MKNKITIGVISDTHGLLRPEAVKALEGSDLIIHAGDVGDPEILTHLEEVAPVTAVRGNIDVGPWAEELPETAIIREGGVLIFIVHNIENKLAKGDPDTPKVLVHGHSHKPANDWRFGNFLLFNPGSAGPRRFKLPISVGRLTIADGKAHGEIVVLQV